MKTILSIQSHVAFGYVGNRAAVFPLQRLGFEVMAVDTVQFSNHTGYGEWTGRVFAPADLADVIDGIAARGGLDHCDAVLSGYLGAPAVGQVVLDALARIRSVNPNVLYCCDPVMGDSPQGFFVKTWVPQFIRRQMVPAADILTPNQFELEFLTGGRIDTLARALAATEAARRMGPRVVLVTSLTRSEASADSMEMLVDTAEGAWLVTTPRLKLDPAPNGTGDCIAALFFAHQLNCGDAAQALARAASSVYGILLATQTAGTRELQLIAAQDQLVAPSLVFHPERVR